jgi:hypothetical protein
VFPGDAAESQSLLNVLKSGLRQADSSHCTEIEGSINTIIEFGVEGGHAVFFPTSMLY